MENKGSMINIGYSCYVSSDKIVAIASPDSSPIKRMVQEARDKGSLTIRISIKTKSVIVTVSDHVILSSRSSEYILGMNGEEEADE